MTQLLLAVAERVILQPTYLRIYKELKNHFHPVGWIIISSRISLRVPHFEKWTWKLLQCIHLSLYVHLKKGSLRKLTCWITYFKDSSFFSPFTLEISLPLAVFSQLWSITKHPGNKLCTTYCQIHTAPTMLTKNNKKNQQTRVSPQLQWFVFKLPATTWLLELLLPAVARSLPAALAEGQRLLEELLGISETSALLQTPQSHVLGQLSIYESWLQLHNRLWWCALRYTCIVHMAKQPTAISNLQSVILVLSGHTVLSLRQVCITLQYSTWI